MTPDTLRIGLATVRNVPTVAERLATADRMLAEAAAQDVAIVCFPETYIPGLRGFDFPVPRATRRGRKRRWLHCRRWRRATASLWSWAWSGKPGWAPTTWRW
ncbi:MAG: hypothetical protein R2853_13015 [Thermomicrobiales bacterium]